MIKLIHVLILFIILLSLISCTTKTEFIEKQVPVFPPDVLLQDCNKTEYNGDKWIDIVNYVLDLRSDLDKCNEDKAALRDWKEKVK